jgi:hypothetical protein
MRQLDSVQRLEDPARDLVAAGDAAEDVEEDRLHLRIARDHLERVDDTLRVAAAAEVAEIRRPAAREGDDVHRRHRQACPVAEHADLAVQLHVCHVLLPRERFERIGGIDVTHLRDVGMAVERVVVDREFGVERPHLTLGGHDQRVDLAEQGIAGDEGSVELPDDRRDLLLLGRVLHPRAVDEPAALPRVEALERVDVQADERLRSLSGHLLDVDAAARREHEQRLLRAPVERQREVVLLLDVRRLLDPEPAHDVAADVQPQNLVRMRLGLVGPGGELDPARLASAARQHLRLDHDVAAQLLRRRSRLGRCGRQPSCRDRDAMAREELLALVLVQVQSARQPTSGRVRASARCRGF